MTSSDEVFRCRYCGKEFDDKRAMLGHENLQCSEKGKNEKDEDVELEVDERPPEEKIGSIYMKQDGGNPEIVLDINGVEIPVEGKFEVREEKTSVSLETFF